MLHLQYIGAFMQVPGHISGDDDGDDIITACITFSQWYMYAGTMLAMLHGLGLSSLHKFTILHECWNHNSNATCMDLRWISLNVHSQLCCMLEQCLGLLCLHTFTCSQLYLVLISFKAHIA